MEKYDLLDTIGYGRYSINEELPLGSAVEIAWPDGASVECVVIDSSENGSVCTPA